MDFLRTFRDEQANEENIEADSFDVISIEDEDGVYSILVGFNEGERYISG